MSVNIIVCVAAWGLLYRDMYDHKCFVKAWVIISFVD